VGKFFKYKKFTDECFAAIPALVKKGEDRRQVIDAILAKWLCTSTKAPGEGDNPIEAHVASDGFFLDRVAFIDENTNEPIDLGEILRLLENRLVDNGEPASFRGRPDLLILLRRCRIDRCNCRGLNIRPRFVAYQTKFGDGADFSRAIFGDGTDFSLATFGDRTCFRTTIFGKRARFFGATFGTKAIFNGAHFRENADFVMSRFGRNASFHLTHMSSADLRGTRGFLPDETTVRDTRFSARARDPWSKLRSAYTGPRLIFNLLFLLLFFLPLGARVVGWAAIGKTEQESRQVVSTVREHAHELQPEHPAVALWVEKRLEGVEAIMPGGSADRWCEMPVWWAVLGFDRGPAIWIPAIAILVYNVLRLGMTFVVAPMRDAEERSGITPRLWGAYFESYGWFITPHRMLTALFWVSVASFIWNGFHWLVLESVWIPR
jgi:hypothetical protein